MTRRETLDSIHEFGKRRRVLKITILEDIKVERIKRDSSSILHSASKILIEMEGENKKIHSSPPQPLHHVA